MLQFDIKIQSCKSSGVRVKKKKKKKDDCSWKMAVVGGVGSRAWKETGPVLSRCRRRRILKGAVNLLNDFLFHGAPTPQMLWHGHSYFHLHSSPNLLRRTTDRQPRDGVPNVHYSSLEKDLIELKARNLSS